MKNAKFGILSTFYDSSVKKVAQKMCEQKNVVVTNIFVTKKIVTEKFL